MTSSAPSIPPQLGVMASQPRSSMYLSASRWASSALASSRARCASAHAGGGMASSMVIRVSECTGVEMARNNKMPSRRIGNPPQTVGASLSKGVTSCCFSGNCSHKDYMGEPLVVGAREFKMNLETYLRRVREGRILTITDRVRQPFCGRTSGSFAEARRGDGPSDTGAADRQADCRKRPALLRRHQRGSGGSIPQRIR